MTAPSSNIRVRSVQGPSRYANIDGLRAVAALCVMTEHLFGDILRQTSPGSGIFRTGLVTITETVSLGRFGVALFFLISGFVVPFSLRGQRPVTHFAISRLFRLYPAMWLAIALLTTLDWIGGEPPRPTVVLANMSMSPTLFGQSWLSPIYWTLSIEFIFYVGIALLFLAGRLRSVGVVSAVAMGLVVATLVPVLMRTHGVVDLPIQYAGFHLSFPFLGLLLRLALVERVRGAWPAVASVLIAQVTTVVAAAGFSLARGDEFILDGLVPVLAAYVLAVAVFCAAVALDRPRSVLLGRIGMISYSMYLLHWIINVNVYRVLPLTGRVGDIATMLVCVASTVAVSAAVYRLIERPMIRLGRTLGARGPRPADASERT